MFQTEDDESTTDDLVFFVKKFDSWGAWIQRNTKMKNELKVFEKLCLKKSIQINLVRLIQI